MRGHARCPEIFQHIEFTTDAFEREQLGEPTQLVFLVHATGAQGALVQGCEAKGIGLTRGRQLRAHLQTLQHEQAVVRASLGAFEGRRIRTRPVVPAHAIGGYKLSALTDQQHIGPGQCGRVGQQFLNEFRSDASGVSGEKSDGGFHVGSIQRVEFMTGR